MPEGVTELGFGLTKKETIAVSFLVKRADINLSAHSMFAVLLCASATSCQRASSNFYARAFRCSSDASQSG